MQLLIPQINSLLQQRGVGDLPSNRNQFCVVQFGARGYEIKAKFVTIKASTFFVSENIKEARKALKRNGWVADGYEAIKFTLDHVPFRSDPSVGRAIVMATNLGRTALAESADLSISYLSNLIGQFNVSLDVIVNATLTKPTSMTTPTQDVPIGFYNLTHTLINNSSGCGYYEKEGGVNILSSHGNTIDSYIKLALNLGGGVWSLDNLLNGSSNTSLINNLAVAMVDGWSLSLLGPESCYECSCVDGDGVCVRGHNQRKCRSCINNTEV